MTLFSDYYKGNDIIKKITNERDNNRDLIYSNLLKFKVGNILLFFFE